MKPTLSGVCTVPKGHYQQRDIDAANATLVVKGVNDKQLKIYRETRRGLVLPRAFAVARFGLDVFRDRMAYGTPIDVEFKAKLDPTREQDRIARETLARVKPGEGGVVHAPCGVGKTVLGLYFIAQWKRTAIVFVHTEFLADQWIAEAQSFLGLSLNEIGRVQRDRCDFVGKKIVIAVTPGVTRSLRARDNRYPKELWDWAGTAVFDEVHRYAAAMWHRAMGAAKSAFRLGLSATPTRPDGMTPVVLQHLGPIVAQATEYQKRPTIYKIRFKAYVPIKSVCYWNGGAPTSRVNLARLINRLSRDQRRNEMLAHYAIDAFKSGRKVIMLTDRLQQIDEIEKIMRDQLDASFSVGRYIGGLTKAERKAASEAPVICGTYAIASEGLNLPWLDTLIALTPRANMEQSVGRILRKFATKKSPIVVDPDDWVSCTPLTTILSRKRDAFYTKHGWTVRQINW